MGEIRDEIRNEIRKEFEKEWKKEKMKNPDCDPHGWWEERRMGMKVFLGFLMGIGGVGLLFLFGWVVMLLWNWLMPEIFGLTTITYWQGWGLLLLSFILFKGMPGGGDHGDGGRRGDRRRRRELRHMMAEPGDYTYSEEDFLAGKEESPEGESGSPAPEDRPKDGFPPADG